MEALATDIPPRLRDGRAKRHSADQALAASSSTHHPSPSVSSHRHSALLSPRLRPFGNLVYEAIHEAERPSLEGSEATVGPSADASRDQTYHTRRDDSLPSGKRHTRVFSCDETLDECTGFTLDETVFMDKPPRRPCRFDIAPFRPLLLSTTIAQRKGVALSLDFIPPPSKYDHLYKDPDKVPWQSTLAKLFEQSQLNSWKTIVVDRKVQQGEARRRQPSRHGHQRRRRYKPRQDGVAPLPPMGSSSEDATSSGLGESMSGSHTRSTRTAAKIDSDAFDSMYEEIQNAYIAKLERKKDLSDRRRSGLPQVALNDQTIEGPGRPSLRGRMFTSMIHTSRNYGTSPASGGGGSGSMLSSESTLPSEEPPRPDTPASMSDNDYVADLSCAETPRKSRRQTKTWTRAAPLPAVSDLGEDFHSSSPRSSFDNIALSKTVSGSSSSRYSGGTAGEEATVLPLSELNDVSNTIQDALHSQSQPQCRGRKHTSVLHFSRKFHRRDRETGGDSKPDESTQSGTVPAAASAAPPPPPRLRQRQIGLAPFGGEWFHSAMPSPIVPSSPPSRRSRKSTGSDKTVISGSSKTFSSKDTVEGSHAGKETESQNSKGKEHDGEMERGRGRRRILPRLGLGGGVGGRTSLDYDRDDDHDRGVHCSSPRSSHDRDRDRDRSGDGDGDLTDSLLRYSSTVADRASTWSAGMSIATATTTGSAAGTSVGGSESQPLLPRAEGQK